MKRLACLLFVAACGTDSTTVEIPEIRSSSERDLTPDISTSEMSAAMADRNAFAADLYRQVHSEPGNLFMSPYSISTALAMTYAGAAGTTADEIAAAMHFGSNPAALHASFNQLELELASREADATGDTIPFKLRTANAVFGQDGKEFAAPFLDTLAVNYDAGMKILDFARAPDEARDTINTWVEERTNNRIEDLLPEGSITSLTKLVLTNAIYFSAAWEEPFEVSDTADRPFFVGDTTVNVPTLYQQAELPYGEGDGWRAAALPYDGNKLQMTIVVPDDLAAFEAGLTGAQLAAITDALTDHDLKLSLPKFKFDAPLGLKKHLQALGMAVPFTSDADFSGIDGTRDLFIHDVLHKGFVAIDEKGTEAAAATAVIVGDASLPMSATLTVDKPFVFFIQDRPTGAILFIGRVLDPR